MKIRFGFTSISIKVILLFMLSLASCQTIENSMLGKQENHPPTISLKEEKQHIFPTNPAAEKLKQGLGSLVEVYNLEGVQAAKAFAFKNSIPISNDKVNVYIYTIGNSASLFIDELDKMGVEQFNASSLANVIQATVSIEQLSQLSEKDFVLYITLPSKINTN